MEFYEKLYSLWWWNWRLQQTKISLYAARCSVLKDVFPRFDYTPNLFFSFTMQDYQQSRNCQAQILRKWWNKLFSGSWILYSHLHLWYCSTSIQDDMQLYKTIIQNLHPEFLVQFLKQCEDTVMMLASTWEVHSNKKDNSILIQAATCM
jgi:hypothetical protein